MALIAPGGLAGAISGKVGNVVYARNRGGAYVRNFVKPVNPQTVLQQANRNAFGTLSAQWKALGGSGQVAFASSAAQVSNPNRVGLTSNPTGLNLFQAVNLGRVAAGLAAILTPPPLPLVYDWEPGLFSLAPSGSNDLTVTFDDTKSWGATTGAGLLIYLSPNVSAATVFYKGGYRLAAVLLGNAGMPLTSPATVTMAAALDPTTAGQRRFFRAYVTMDDGSIGQVTTGFFDVAPLTTAVGAYTLGGGSPLHVQFAGPISPASLAGVTATVAGRVGSPSTTWIENSPTDYSTAIIGSTGDVISLTGSSLQLALPATVNVT